ncbi:response regulator transcription factor [Achromobacter xylosoxidans]
MKNTTLNLIVADDHPIVRRGVQAILSEHPIRYKVVGEAGDGEELLARLAATPGIDVVVTDFAMSQDGQDGLRLFRRLREQYPDLAIVVLTMLNNAGLFHSIHSLGIHCIVSKRSLNDDLCHAIENAMRHRPFMSADVEEQVGSSGFAQSGGSGKVTLSPREVETLRLLLTGLSVSEIARTLHRSKKTISAQKQAAMTKLGLENDSQLFEYLHNYFEH